MKKNLTPVISALVLKRCQFLLSWLIGLTFVFGLAAGRWSDAFAEEVVDWLQSCGLNFIDGMQRQGITDHQVMFILVFSVLLALSQIVLLLQRQSLWSTPYGIYVPVSGYFAKYFYFHKHYSYRNTGSVLSIFFFGGSAPAPDDAARLVKTSSTAFIREYNSRGEVIGMYCAGALLFFLVFFDAKNSLLGSRYGFALSFALFAGVQVHLLYDLLLFLLVLLFKGK